MRSEHDQPIGALLDSLGVTLDLKPGQQLVEVLVLAKVADFSDDSGVPRLGLGSSTGLDWMAELALVRSATLVIEQHLHDHLFGDSE